MFIFHFPVFYISRVWCGEVGFKNKPSPVGGSGAHGSGAAIRGAFERFTIASTGSIDFGAYPGSQGRRVRGTHYTNNSARIGFSGWIVGACGSDTNPCLDLPLFASFVVAGALASKKDIDITGAGIIEGNEEDFLGHDWGFTWRTGLVTKY